MIIFRAGFTTMEEREYLFHAPHRITSIFPTHDFHHLHSHNTIFVTYITGLQVIFFFFFWQYNSWWTLASSKSFLQCSVQVIIFFFFVVYFCNTVSHYTASMGGKFMWRFESFRKEVVAT